MWTLSNGYRTKAETAKAIREGEKIVLLFSDEHETNEFPRASGEYTVRFQLDHYKEWTGIAVCRGDGIYRLK